MASKQGALKRGWADHNRLLMPERKEVHHRCIAYKLMKYNSIAML